MDIMCEVNHKQKESAHVENGVKLPYLQIMKDLYGCMEYALLWYDIYSNNLKSYLFMANPYDRCISNSTIKVKQYTIECVVRPMYC